VAIMPPAVRRLGRLCRWWVSMPANGSGTGTGCVPREIRVSSGVTTIAVGGVLRTHGGRIAYENRCRSPVSGSTRLSFTRGTATGTDPALVSTSRGSW
jgi:hypothetical protein